MKVYLAGDGQHKVWEALGIFDFNRLSSFYGISKKEIPFIPRYNNFMLDSGAFTFMKSKTNKINWEQYIEDYGRFVVEHNIKYFFELDIDNIVGITEVERLRHRLESITQRQCIPVFHKSRGKEYWIKMTKEYRYVSIGGIVTREIKPKEYYIFDWFIREASRNGAVVHALGFTNLKPEIRFPFHSGDSTYWLYGNQWGRIDKFNGDTIVSVKAPENKRVIGKKAITNNFLEWYKFTKYMETKI